MEVEFLLFYLLKYHQFRNKFLVLVGTTIAILFDLLGQRTLIRESVLHLHIHLLVYLHAYIHQLGKHNSVLQFTTDAKTFRFQGETK